MVNKLLKIGKPVGAIAERSLREIAKRGRSLIAVVFLSTQPLGASSTEYVFTAPPEVNRQIVETPPRQTDYPLYECRTETVAKSEKAMETRGTTEATEVNQALDRHDCNCQDCEDKLEKSELAPADQP